MNAVNETPKKKLVLFLYVLIGFLVLALGFLVYEYTNMQKQNKQAQTFLEDQKNELTRDLNNMMGEYEGLRTTNDSMNNKIEEQQTHIQKLLAFQASNGEKIRLYKKELTTLRDVMKSYIIQIDSLNQRNQRLVSENKEVKTRLDEARRSNESLSQEKATLTSKVDQASQLMAKDIVITTMNKSGNPTNKVSRVAKIQVCFALRENSVTEPGTKTIFLRIARPDQMVLTSSENNVTTLDGQQIIYTAKREVEYENKDLEACIFSDGIGLTPGSYTIDLFEGGKLIGSSSFALK